MCEVGFNAGHSTALWLHANPLVHVHSFDIQHKTDVVGLLQRQFPGRLHTYTGDSATLIGPTTLPAPCDLVHIDGRHDYTHTVGDFLSLQPKVQPRRVAVKTVCPTRRGQLCACAALPRRRVRTRCVRRAPRRGARTAGPLQPSASAAVHARLPSRTPLLPPTDIFDDQCNPFNCSSSSLVRAALGQQ